MKHRRIVARATALTATAVVIASGFTTDALAAGSADVTSGSPALNTVSKSVTIAVDSTYVPGPTATVTLTRHGSSAPEDVLTATGTATAGAPGTQTVTA